MDITYEINSLAYLIMGVLDKLVLEENRYVVKMIYVIVLESWFLNNVRMFHDHEI